MNKKICKRVVPFIIISVMCLAWPNIGRAAYFSNDINSIDETKYPGYKEKLQLLKKVYPNIQILYTGLDWNTVISNEHNLAHGRNLVDTTSKEEWICQECKSQGVWYDSGKYCASEEAVKYVMDPRNYLDTNGIFQFQKLNTAVGTNPSEIKKVLEMQDITYLKNDQEAINAFSKVAENKNLNAYHLVTRVIQEQGKSGTSVLSAGQGYSGNGFQNYGYGLYNLFSIGATKKKDEPAHMILINALDRAATEGWTSRALSILGGGNFVGNSYIDVGQNTLYFQKFSVYNTNGALYWHQYMQNLFGAQNEAKILYSTYQTTGIEMNKDFQFIIPLYDNMPKIASKRPGSQYNGYMTSKQYGNVTLNGNNIMGKLIVQEWLNGTQQIEPTVNPKIVLRANDGTSVNCNVTYVEPYVYQYSINVNSIDVLQEYKIEVECGNSNNTSEHTVVIIDDYKDHTIGKANGINVYMKKNSLSFTYDGYMTNTPYGQVKINGNMVDGELIIQEWLNGTKQMEPTVMPKVILKAEDGTIVTGKVNKVEPYIYRYQFNVGIIDNTKKYEIEVQSGTTKNVSNHAKVVVNYKDQTIGKMVYYTVTIKNKRLGFSYNGYMLNSEYSKISLEGSKIKGKLVVQEWLNGTKQMEPTVMPKIVIKDEAGKEVAVGSMKKVEPYVYSYEIEIGNLDKSKKYMVEVQGTNANNISDHQKVVVAFSNQDIGILGDNKVKIENGKMIYQDKNKYNGYMTNAEYGKISLEGSKIKGKLVVQEWLNGTKQMEPTVMPKIVIKDEAGKEVAVGSMKKVEPYVYSYEIEIGNLDKSKKYMVEVQGTNANNISDHQKVVVAFSNQDIGILGDNKVKIENGKMIYQDKNKYNGYMTNAEYGKISLEGSKIKGKLVVQEWLNGTKQIEPTSLPKIVIKDETKKEVAVGSMKKVEPYVYSYEIEIGNLDKSKKYMVEVQGTNANNISDHQKVVVAFSNQDIGTLGEYQVKVENTNLIFKGKNNKYNGYMTNFEYSKISLEGSKIKGKLVVQEWLNGTKQIEPTSLPKIVIKDETKKEVAVGSMKKVEPYVYSYEIEIGNLDKSKKYMVEVQGTNANNISDHQKVVVAFSNQDIGTIATYKVYIRDSRFIFN